MKIPCPSLEGDLVGLRRTITGEVSLDPGLLCLKLSGASLNCRWLGATRRACGQEEQEREDGETHGASGFVRPNVEVTGATRQGGQAVRPMMNQGGRTAWLTCRGASG